MPLLFHSLDEEMRLRAAAILGVCAGPTAPSSIHYFSRIFRIRGRVDRLLKFIAGVDGIPPILLLGFAAGLLHVSNLGLGEGLPGWKWLSATARSRSRSSPAASARWQPLAEQSTRIAPEFHSTR